MDSGLNIRVVSVQQQQREANAIDGLKWKRDFFDSQKDCSPSKLE